MKGLRAEAGYSPARNTSETTAVDSSNTYAGNTDQSHLIQSFEGRKATNGLVTRLDKGDMDDLHSCGLARILSIDYVFGIAVKPNP